MQEIWKDIKGYEGLYQVSNLGRVKSLNYNHTKKEKILSLDHQKNGYLRVILQNKNKITRYRVHRLVAKTFISENDNSLQVNHIDGNKQNNCVTNLEWCTAKENTNHALNNGMVKMKRISMYDKQNNLLKKFNNIREIRKYLNIQNTTHIHDCCRGERKSAMGYKWRYEE